MLDTNQKQSQVSEVLLLDNAGSQQDKVLNNYSNMTPREHQTNHTHMKSTTTFISATLFVGYYE
jgi:hypothetical protein